MYQFKVGDQGVIRQDSTNLQRLGRVISVNGRGEALFELFRDQTFRREGKIQIRPDGSSGLGLFTLIKYIPLEEYLSTGRCNVK